MNISKQIIHTYAKKGHAISKKHIRGHPRYMSKKFRTGHLFKMNYLVKFFHRSLHNKIFYDINSVLCIHVYKMKNIIILN